MAEIRTVTTLRRKRGEISASIWLQQTGPRAKMAALKMVGQSRKCSLRFSLEPFRPLCGRGIGALDEYREKFVDRYVENYAMLARIIRVEADVKHSMATPWLMKLLPSLVWGLHYDAEITAARVHCCRK